MKIILNEEVRTLLKELDDVMQKFHAATAVLADRTTPLPTAIDIGAERESIRTHIVGIAWRLNKASTGRKE
jgi:hypothetical protein